MAKYLTYHRHQYYFNLSVPSDLVTALGKSKISEPLAPVLDEAEILKHDRLLFWKRQFKEIRDNYGQLNSKVLTSDIPSLITTYLSEEKLRISNQHLLDKQRYLQQLQDTLGDNTFISDVTRRTASDYLRDIITPNHQSYRTKEKHLFVLSSFFRWCVRSGFLDHNPFADMAFLLGNKSVTVTKKPYNQKQLNQLLSAMPERLRVLSAIALYSGLRIEEVCQLKTVDVNEGFEVKQGKNHNSIRVVPIHSALTDLVNNLKATSPDGYLIPNLTPAGRSNKRSHNISKRFGRYKTKLGFGKEQDFHSLRRTFATALENAGVPESTISQLMGHKKQSISLYLYSGGLEFTRLQQEIERINFNLT
jgi:integrase